MVTSKHLNVETREGAEADRKINQSGSRNGELVLQGRWRKSRDNEARSEQDR